MVVAGLGGFNLGVWAAMGGPVVPITVPRWLRIGQLLAVIAAFGVVLGRALFGG